MIKKIISGGQTGADQAVMRLLTTVFHMELIENSMPDPRNPNPLLPETVEEVVRRLVEELPLRDKTQIAKTEEPDLIFLPPGLGTYIRNKYLWNGNEPLKLDCMYKSGKLDIDENDIISIIIHDLWKQLSKTHRLRIVK